MPIGNWANSQQHNATFSLSVALTCKRKKKRKVFLGQRWAFAKVICYLESFRTTGCL